ncbi:hypothetical protein [uncultured Clostridium sp.]|jgi:hypothetical protein|uniref:hypothetical protein n=1 Tax=uncultured Clostridium sp. TaxID=59620 RepID=UPI002635539F|nr:hypothetical protein [uncultured Clostridium sp.]
MVNTSSSRVEKVSRKGKEKNRKIKNFERKLDALKKVDSFIDEFILDGVESSTVVRISTFEKSLGETLKVVIVSEHRYIILECIELFKEIIKNRENINETSKYAYSEKSLYRKVAIKLNVLKEFNKVYKVELLNNYRK